MTAEAALQWGAFCNVKQQFDTRESAKTSLSQQQLSQSASAYALMWFTKPSFMRFSWFELVHAAISSCKPQTWSATPAAIAGVIRSAEWTLQKL